MLPDHQGPASPSPHPPRPVSALGAQRGRAPGGHAGTGRRPPLPSPTSPRDLPAEAWTPSPYPRIFHQPLQLLALSTPAALFGTARGSPLNPHLGSPWGGEHRGSAGHSTQTMLGLRAPSSFTSCCQSWCWKPAGRRCPGPKG